MTQFELDKTKVGTYKCLHVWFFLLNALFLLVFVFGLQDFQIDHIKKIESLQIVKGYMGMNAVKDEYKELYYYVWGSYGVWAFSAAYSLMSMCCLNPKVMCCQKFFNFLIFAANAAGVGLGGYYFFLNSNKWLEIVESY